MVQWSRASLKDDWDHPCPWGLAPYTSICLSEQESVESPRLQSSYFRVHDRKADYLQ